MRDKHICRVFFNSSEQTTYIPFTLKCQVQGFVDHLFFSISGTEYVMLSLMEKLILVYIPFSRSLKDGY
jgi:hypothetical protein